MTWGFAALGALQGLSSGLQQAKGFERQGDVDTYNAKVTRMEAKQTYAVSGQKESEFRRNQAFQLGEQRAAGGQSGFTPSGSILDTERQSAILAELDAQNLRFEGQQKGQSLTSQADLLKYSAKVNRFNAGAARLGALLSAASGGAQGYGAGLQIEAARKYNATLADIGQGSSGSPYHTGFGSPDF